MKIIPFFLPQYHRTPYNDEWWGEGFTEWTNVKRARPVFKGQIQPKIPLNNNYYDLMNKKTVEWQTELLHKYKIYGLCYFHYWFKGIKVLEKPAENLLKWRDIRQNFCFAWANVTWARTWTTIKQGSTNWVPNDIVTDKPSVLLEQKYGEKDDWIVHYNYLRNFFLDDRYIKVDNKPMFLIYHVEMIPKQNEMFQLWNDMATKDGFNGIHIVSMNQIPQNKYIEAVARYGGYNKGHIIRRLINKLIRLSKLPIKPLPSIYDYEEMWKSLTTQPISHKYKTYLGGTVSGDDTPRKGVNGLWLKHSSPKIYKEYLKKQIQREKNECNGDYIFIDSWNEWAEGSYLEPDTINEYAYLQATKEAIEEVC